MLRCFDPSVDGRALDRDPFKFHHQLMGHPALELENLAKVIPSLPAEYVKYSKGLMRNGEDFENCNILHRSQMSLAETIEQMRTSDSYVMVRSPQIHESFQPVFRDLSGDVEHLLRQMFGQRERLLIKPQLYLFIASPGSHTPFHIDRNSTMLLQFRGSKQVVLFPRWETRVVTDEAREAYAAYDNTKLPWSEERDAFGQRFDFSPGEGLHIPFIAGHYVQNGMDDVSISMSIIFNTPESQAQLEALQLNHKLRGMGWSPSAVGQSQGRDQVKSFLWRARRKVRHTLHLPPDH